MQLSKQPCTIMTVIQTSRTDTAPRVQNILTAFGCIICVRVGLHEVTPEFCSPQGLILLLLRGSDEEIANLARQLRKLDGVRVQTMRLK